MNFGKFAFGTIKIDGVRYEHGLVIDRGRIGKRKKKPSKKFRADFGHTPVSVEERIPWKCRRLVIGTGRYGSLPVIEEVKREAPPQSRSRDSAHRRALEKLAPDTWRYKRHPPRDVLNRTATR